MSDCRFLEIAHHEYELLCSVFDIWPVWQETVRHLVFKLVLRSFERLSGTPLFRIPHEQSIEVLQQLYVLHCEPDRQEATGMSDREALLGELYSLPAVRALGILANTPRQAAE